MGVTGTRGLFYLVECTNRSYGLVGKVSQFTTKWKKSRIPKKINDVAVHSVLSTKDKSYEILTHQLQSMESRTAANHRHIGHQNSCPQDNKLTYPTTLDDSEKGLVVEKANFKINGFISQPRRRQNMWRYLLYQQTWRRMCVPQPLESLIVRVKYRLSISVWAILAIKNR